jgi:hypothetical protein
MGTMTERLTLCLIVKDEADMLPDFLASVSGLWDELIAVDTGSRDATAELLRHAGAKVLHRPWTHDFAAARNHSLDAASGDWILVLDADERCSPEFVTEARALLCRADVGAATVQMRNVREDGHVHEARLLRMFRRSDAVRYRHAIHEDVAETLWPVLAARGQQLVHLSAPVEHLGYARSVAAARGKKERDLAILDASLQRDPDDLYLHFKRLEQARFWNDQELWHSAAHSAREAVLRTPRTAMGHSAGELVVMVALGLHPDDARAGLAELDALARYLDGSPAVFQCRGELLERSGCLVQAAAAFEQALVCRAPVVNQQLTGVRPLMGLVRLAIANGDLTRACAYLQRALQLEPADPEALFARQMLVAN